MKKIIFTFLIILLSTFVQAQTLTDSLTLENTQDITKIFKALSDIQNRLTALETDYATSAQIDSLKKELKGVVTKSWVVQEIVNRAVLDTTYAGNKKIRRRDGKPLMHRQLVLQQKQNQKIAVQASADVFLVQEYLGTSDSTTATAMLKKLRENTREIKAKAEQAGYKTGDIIDGKVVIIR